MGLIKWFLLAVGLLLSASSIAQDGYYMVFFTDKNNTPYSLDRPLEFLSQRALDRRAKQGIALSAEDLPVNPSYVEGVQDLEVLTYHTSKWFNGLLVEASEDQLDALEGLSFVDSVLFVAPPRNLGNARQANKKTFDPIGGLTQIFSSQNAAAQLSLNSIDEMHENGFEGQGMLIGVFDDGFFNYPTNPGFAHLVEGNRVVDTYDFTNHKSEVSDVPYAHGINVLSIIGARPTPSADLTGAAPEASFLLYVSEDSRWEYRVEEFNWIFAAERADSTGVDIINTSLGYTNGFGSSAMNYTPADMDGKTTVISRGAEKAFSKGIFLVASAGNYGSGSWRVIASPADAEHVLAVGATNSAGVLAGYSSRGPTADGRVKPDAMSMGQGTFALRSHGARFSTTGTSFSAPLITGFVANIWQEFPDFTNQQLLDFIRKAGDRYENPDADFGYGFPNYQRLKDLLITSVASNEEEGVIHAFPNPFLEQLQIQSTGVFEPNALLNIDLYDMAGRAVMNHKLSTGQQGRFSSLLETGNVPPGLYILKLNDGRQQKFLRVIKR